MPEGLEIPADFREPVVTSLSGPSWKRSDITLARWQVKGLLGISVSRPAWLVFYFLFTQLDTYSERRQHCEFIIASIYLIHEKCKTRTENLL